MEFDKYCICENEAESIGKMADARQNCVRIMKIAVDNNKPEAHKMDMQMQNECHLEK